MDDDFELELKEGFLEESADLLESAETAFMRLESERNDPELLNEIFRLAHNLKGTSKAVGFQQLSDLTHIAENLILKLKEGQLEVTDAIVSLLLEFKDKVNEMVEGLKGDFDAQFEIKTLQDKLDAACNAEAAPESELPDAEDSLDEPASESPSTEDNVYAFDPNQNDDIPSSDAFEEQNDEAADPTSAAPITQKTEEKPAALQPPSSGGGLKKPAAATADESIRVKLSKIDEINNVIGELVILQTVISQRRFVNITDDISNKSIGMMNKLFKEVQELSMSLRMLPIKSTFQKMNRIVRDTSKALGKDIHLELNGEETDVDKTVLEKLADPLVHIVRNSADHGIEMPEDRKAKGKPEKGVIKLFAYHEGSNLVIQIVDDGKGINPDVIRKKAIEKGVITDNTNMSDHEVIQLIFHPGFSTKEAVTELSGRGVGMDVVKTNIESLGGAVRLASKVDKGSIIKIVLPLTLAIIEGINIQVESKSYVIPLSQVHEFVQVKAKDIQDFSGVAKLLELRGEVLPLFFLHEKLSAKCKARENYTVLIIRGLSFAFGVIIDEIINQQQIVIKKLGEDIRNQKGIMGSAIMSDGKPSLILDMHEFFKDDLKKSSIESRHRSQKSA